MSYEDGNKVFEDFSKKVGKQKIFFQTEFIKYVKKKISKIVFDPNRNVDFQKITIQKIIFHSLEHRFQLHRRYPDPKARKFTEKYLTLFNKEIYDKAHILFQYEKEIHYYPTTTHITIPSHLLDDIINVLNIINIPYSSDPELSDDNVYLFQKEGEYYLDNKKMKFNTKSVYLPILNLIYKHKSKTGGSITFDNLMRVSEGKIPELKTSPGRTKEDIYKTIRSTLLTNGNGIRRAAGSKSGLMESVIYSEYGSNIITFRNIR
jgi:hypothetical protein